MTIDRFRVCPEGRQLCLKVEEYSDLEDEDYDPLMVCRDCNEEMVAAIPSEHFQELAARNNASADTVLAGLQLLCPQASPTTEASVDWPHDDVQDLDVNEISDRCH